MNDKIEIKAYWKLKKEVGFILGFKAKDLKNFFKVYMYIFIFAFIFTRIVTIFIGLSNIIVLIIALIAAMFISFFLTVPDNYSGMSMYEQIIKKYLKYASEENIFINER